jgi:flagellar biogenesis protein FliO
MPLGAIPMLPLVLGEDAARASTLGGPDMTRYLLVCGLLVVFVIALGAAFKRLFGARLARRAALRSLQIVDVLPLGGRQKLAVVRCYDRTFLLGLGDKEIERIAELDAEQEATAEPEAEATAESPGVRVAFREILARRRTRPASEAAMVSETVEPAVTR